ncbi:MAG: hypothetical protein MUC29_13875 [Pyrinomonadaceae bacterium]|jgi:multidrug resistance efflux pump|nr:hypothetical protein [Pyrinomonadaceae bacterium]
MKKFVCILSLVFLFTFVASAQSIKTDEARQLKKLEKTIRIYEIQFESAKNELDRKSSREYSGVYSESDRQSVRNTISEYEKKLAELYLQRKQLLAKQMTRTLPNTQIELLKLLILQNEKIIDLLEEKSN